MEGSSSQMLQLASKMEGSGSKMLQIACGKDSSNDKMLQIAFKMEGSSSKILQMAFKMEGSGSQSCKQHGKWAQPEIKKLLKLTKIHSQDNFLPINLKHQS